MRRAEEIRVEQSRLLDLTNDTIFVWNIDGPITYWNRGATEAYGYTREEAMGECPRNLLHTEFPEPLEHIQAKLKRNGRWSGELVHTRKDGAQLIVMSRWALDRGGGGRAASILESNNDITQRKRAEMALAAAKAAAEAANAAKSQFLANMSHELRTPMNAILGMIDVALPKAADPIIQDCLQTVKGSADLLLTLLNDLLDSAKIDSGKLQLESAPFSLRRMLDQLTHILAREPARRGWPSSAACPRERPMRW